MEALVLKLGGNVGTAFIFSLDNLGRSSLNAHVVILPQNDRLWCDFSSMMFFSKKKLNISFG